MFNQKIADAYLELFLKSDKFKAGTRDVQYSLKNLTVDVAKTAAGFAGGIGLTQAINKVRQVTIGAVKDFAQFEVGMRAVSTLVDTQITNMDDLSKSVIQLSNRFGKDKNGLTGALYEAISAGVDAADSIKFLEVATKAAIGGVTDTKIVVDGLTSTLNAYGLGADQAEMVSDVLFKTIKVGKTTMDELSGAMGGVAAMANSAGMSLDELGSAIATLTLSGLSTSEAATTVRSLLSGIIKPSDDARKLAEQLGIQFDVASVKAMGFSKWLEELRSKTGGSSTALSVLVPNVRGLNGVVMLTNDGFKRFNETMEEMQTKTGATSEAADKLEGSLSRLWETAVSQTKNAITDSAPIIVLSNLLKGMLKNYTEAKLDTKYFEDALAASNPELLNNDQLQRIIDSKQKEVENWQKISEAWGPRNTLVKHGALGDPGQAVKNLEEYTDKLQQIVDMRNMEAGVNKRIADEQMARRRQVEDAAKAAAQAEEERVQKELEEAKKKAEAEAEKIRNAEKSKDAAEKNAELLKSIEEDKIRVSERVISIQEEQAVREIDLKRESIEQAQNYNSLYYQSQIEQLEVLVNDEKRSIPERLQANQELFDKKKEMSEKEKEYRLEILKLILDEEKLSLEQTNAGIDRYILELEGNFDGLIKKVKESSLPNKQAVEKGLREEKELRIESLKDVQEANKDHFEKMEESGRAAAENIELEIKNRLTKEFQTNIKTSVELDKSLKKSVDETTNTIVRGMSGILNRSITSFGNSVSETFNAISQTLASTSSSFLEKFTKGAGQSFGPMIGTLISFWSSVITENMRMWEEDEARIEYEQEAKRQLYAQTIQTLNLAIIKTREWMDELNKTDISNWSIEELREGKADIANRLADNVNAALGSGQLTGEDYFTLYDLIGSKDTDPDKYKAFIEGIAVHSGSGGSKPVYQKYIEGGAISEREDVAIQRFVAGIGDKFAYRTRPEGRGPGFSAPTSAINDEGFIIPEDWFKMLFSEIDTSALEQISKYNEEIKKRELGQSGIDHTKSIDREDFLADLEAEKASGAISGLDYYKILYEASNIRGSHARNGIDPYDWFREDEKTKYKADYEQALLGGSISGIIGLSEGGIVMAPTFAHLAEHGSPEAVVPLDRLPEFQSLFAGPGSRFGAQEINVNVGIDPNIPLTQDTATALSRQIGARIETILRSKG
jgi:TP901 family phage tail tape measure protein